MSEVLSVSELDIALDDLVQWERFAYHLPGITSTDVKTIQKNKRDDNEEQKLALYEVWLDRYPKGTWKDIIGSLEKAKHNSLAEKLKKKHTIAKTPKEGAAKEIHVQKHVVNELERLHRSFVHLVMDVQQGINEAVECGKMSLLQLKNRTEEERAFTIPELRKVQTINDYFNAIRPHYTFLNCHLLVCIALMLLDPIRAAANKYKRKVDALKKNTAVKRFKDTLQQYLPPLSQREADTIIPVIIRLEDTWERADIWLVEELVRKLFDLRHPDQCQWFRVVQGSVMAVFLAPKHMMMSMIVSASKRRGLMTLLGVNAISVGECVILVRDGGAEPFNLFTSLLYDAQNGYNTTELLLKRAKSDLNRVIQTKQLDQTQAQNQQFNSQKLTTVSVITELVKYELIPKLESAVSSGCLTLKSLVSCVNESIDCPIEELANVQSVHELFQIIQPYYSFLNNHILQQLVLQLSEEDTLMARQELGVKANSFKEDTKLFEIIKPLQDHFDVSSIVFPFMMKVTLALDNTWQTATMKAVEQLIQFLFYLKHPDELLWHKIRYGSVIIEFLTPKNMMMHLITNSVKQKQLMTLTGVMRLQIGNIVIHKTTQQLTLAESRDESKNLQSTKALAIYEAYVGNHPDNTIKVLVDINNNCNFESIISSTYLMLACMYSDSSLAKLLLECSADPNHDEGQTALMFASQTGDIRLMELLLSYGANINQKRLNGYTALMMAAYTGNIRSVKFLIEANADLYCTEISQALTAIHIAANNGHTQVVEILLDAQVDVDIHDAINKRTCLHYAAEYEDNLDTVQLLIKRNANVDAQDSLGYTPLYTAAREGNLRIVDQLICANADIEIAIHDQQWTPLHIASRDGSPLVVKRLLKANANKNARDKFFQTPLICAIIANNTEVVKVLLEAGADPDPVSISQISAIGMASEKGNAKIIELLLERGANLYSQDKDGVASFHAACRGGYMDVVEVLLKAGINPNIPRDDGMTPLHQACYFGRKNIVKRLLKEGVDINAKTEKGLTPVHMATMTKQMTIVEILLRAGADPYIADNNGMTPYHKALELNNVELMVLLKKAMKH